MKVALLVMPFAPLDFPNLQIGLLKSWLKSNDFEADDYYLNLELASKIGFPKYEKISRNSRLLLGDWIFNTSTGKVENSEDYLDITIDKLTNFYSNSISKIEIKENLLEIKNICNNWLSDRALSFPSEKYDLIGLSSSYSPISSSLLFAEKIKQKKVKPKIILGGSCLSNDYVNEIYKKVPWIDTFVVGEGEEALLKVAKLIKNNKKIPKKIQNKKKQDLNLLPPPNYDTYYSLLESNEFIELKQKKAGRIVIETSRGCWWGEKNRCKFCGLVGNEDIKFREKSCNNIINDLSYLSERYNRFDFISTDPIIGPNVVNKLFPYLADRKLSYDFFFELKPKATTEYFDRLKKASVTSIQPGIESLNSEILKIINKGSTATSNLEILRLSKNNNIDIYWNILIGFPGEKAEYYKKMLALIPKIIHLQPPRYIDYFRLEKYSPFFEEYLNKAQRNSTLPISNIRPIEQYKFCFSKDINLMKIAYYFDYDLINDVPSSLYSEFISKVNEWQELWNIDVSERPQLKVKKGIKSWSVFDLRSKGTLLIKLDSIALSVAELLNEKPRSYKEIKDLLKIYNEKDLIMVLDYFTEMSLVVKPDDRYVWLPVIN